MKKSSVLALTAGCTLLLSTALTLVIGSTNATSTNDAKNTSEQSEVLSISDPTKLPSTHESVYVITNQTGDPESIFIGSTLSTSTEPLPVSLKITYSLDGSEISASELAHKSGHVKITFDCESTKSYQNKLVPFLVTTGLTLDSSKFKNLKIKNGKEISENDSIIVAGYSFAGLGEDLDTDIIPSSFTLEADTTDFTLENTYTLATNEIFAHIDTSKLSTIDNAINAINQLADGLDSIIAGSKDLSSGLDAALSGANQLQTGAKKLETGASTLAAGAAKLNSGADELSAGLGKVKDGTSLLAEKTTALENGLSQLSSNSEALRAGAKTTFEGLLASANSTISNNDGLMNIIAAYNVPFPLTIDNYDSSLTSIISYVSASPLDPNAKETIIQQLTTLKSSLSSYNEFYNGILSYTGSVDYIANQLPALSAGTAELASGTNALSTGASTLKDGTKALSDGISNLSTGSTELSSGVDTLTFGIAQLDDGGHTLTAGLLTFKSEGIDRLVSLANNDLDSFLRNFRATVSAANSYHHYSNQNSLDVKFIFKTPSIK